MPPVNFESILFQAGETPGAVSEPAHFLDLRLDQIVAGVVAGKSDYDLKPFLYSPLRTPDDVEYRQEVMRDFENGPRKEAVADFSRAMRRARTFLATSEKLSTKPERERWLLEAALIYVGAIEELRRQLDADIPLSRGVFRFRAWLAAHIASPGFTTLAVEARRTAAALGAIRYCLLLKDSAVTVRPFDTQLDYAATIEASFARFRQEPAKDYRVTLTTATGLNHVESQILQRVAQLNPEPFDALARFCEAHHGFFDPLLVRFDREAQVYLGYQDFIAPLKAAGLPFCYPLVSKSDKRIESRNGFDLALAAKLLGEHQAIVPNDFELSGGERIMVVTGPNQGGKTTFSRAFGQLHYLASLGFPVPGSEARLFLCDRIFTHFEREETMESLHGKLEADVMRIQRILDEITPDSLVILNELFSSTALEDAVALSRKVMARISEADLLCVWVTFLEELASSGVKTASYVAAVDPTDPARRTFRIERRSADGLSHAVAIAQKYRLTYHQLKERLAA